MSIFVWLLSTAALFVVCTLLGNLIEAVVHNYAVRVCLMLLAGVAIGALASAIGYGFFVLACLLLWRAWQIRNKLLPVIGEAAAATKYALPTMLLVVSATLFSYVFSVEHCPSGSTDCQRIFFERVYTPPHLVRPK